MVLMSGWLTKRQKFIVSSILMTIGLWGVGLVDLEYRYVAIFVLFLMAYGISAFALLDDLKGVEWFTLLILPAMFAGAMALFSMLLPEHWLASFVTLLIFGLGTYALFLTENIYSVAAARTIQLLRAAHAVGFLLSILVLVLGYNSIFSFQLSGWWNALLVWGMTIPVFLQGLWSVELGNKLSMRVWRYSILASSVCAQLALMLGFLPSTVWISSLFVATAGYVLLGLLQHEIQQKLFERTVYEYVGVGVFVLVASLLVMPW